MFQRAVFGLVKPFLLEQSWNKPGNRQTQTIVYLMNNMNKLFLACGRIGLSPVGIAFVPAVLFQGRFPKQEGPEGKPPSPIPQIGAKVARQHATASKEKARKFPRFFCALFWAGGIARDCAD